MLANVLLYQKLGVNIVPDSERFLGYTKLLQQGIWYQSHNFWYLGYVLFIFVVQLFTTSSTVLIVCQVLLSLLALVALYYAAFLLFSKRVAAFISALCYLIFLELHSWNFYVVAESYYTSFICFSLLALVLAEKQQKSLLPVLLLVVYTFFIRPTGVALLLAFASYLAVKNHAFFYKHRVTFILLGVVGGVGLFFLLNSMLATFVDSILYNDYGHGEIIWGISQEQHQQYHRWFKVTPPDDLYFPEKEMYPVLRLLAFVAGNPLYYLKLCFLKLLVFFGHIRPYHSTLHNVLTVGTLYPLYLFFFIGFRKARISAALTTFFVVYLCIHAAIIMITTVDWDGRFIMPLLPAFCLFAGRGVYAFGRRLFFRSNTSLQS